MKKEKLSLNGSDINLTDPQDNVVISTEVTKEENGIDILRMVAANTNGQLILSKIRIGDEIIVSYTDDAGNLVQTFVGNTEEINPSLDHTGQIAEVVCFGKGYCLKLARINVEYGQVFPQLGDPNNKSELPSTYNPIGQYNRPLNYTPVIFPVDALYRQSSFTGNNNWSLPTMSPYTPLIPDYPYCQAYNDYVLPGGNAIGINLNWSSDSNGNVAVLGSQFGYWTFAKLLPHYRKILFTMLNLHICALLDIGIADCDFNIRPYISLNNGESWTALNEGFFDHTQRQAHGGVQYPLELTFNGNVGLDITGYVDDYTNFDNILVKVEFAGINTEDNNSGTIFIDMIYLEALAYPTWWNEGNTIKDVISGTPDLQTTGSHTSHSQNLMSLMQSFKDPYTNSVYYTSGNNFMSFVLGTDHINNFAALMPYIMFQYLDVFTCINDLVRTACAVDYVNKGGVGYKGLHWGVFRDSNNVDQLMIQPVGNHDSDAETLWNSNCPDSPIKVGQDMISERFTTKMPPANMVIVSGVFRHPLNDDYTENSKMSKTQPMYGWCKPGTAFPGTCTASLDATNYMIGNCSIMLSAPIEGIYSTEYAGIKYLIHPITGANLTIDFTQLMGSKARPSIHFWFKAGLNSNSYKLRLYSGLQYVTAPNDENLDNTDYFEYDFSKEITNTDTWFKIDIEIPNNYIASQIDNTENGNLQGNWSAVGNADWTKIQRWGISFKTYNPTSSGNVTVWIDEFEMVGNLIRCIFDSQSIATYGLRTIVLKNSLAEMDTLDPTDIMNPLSQFALAELVRGNLVVTTGTVQIPLNPHILQGQIVQIITPEFPEQSVTMLEPDLIVNGGFEVGYDGWTVTDEGGNSTIISPGYIGNSCIRLKGQNGYAGGGSIEPINNIDIPNDVSIIDKFGFMIKDNYYANGNGQSLFNIVILDSEGNGLSNQLYYTPTVSGDWQWMNMPYVAGMKSFFIREGTNCSGDIYIDGITCTLKAGSGTIYSGTFFRINKVVHRFSDKGAFTELHLTSDLYNSMPISFDYYSQAMRAISPDVQTKTFTSIRNGEGAFDPLLTPIYYDIYTKT